VQPDGGATDTGHAALRFLRDARLDAFGTPARHADVADEAPEVAGFGGWHRYFRAFAFAFRARVYEYKD